MAGSKTGAGTCGHPLLPQRAPGGQRAYLVGRGAVVVVGALSAVRGARINIP